MSDFLDYSTIKRKIENEKCREHNSHPEFVKTATGFQINSCCDDFKDRLVEEAKKIITAETKSAIQKMMKKAFKK